MSTYTIVSGCPEDVEPQVPSENIEFPGEVVKSFMTFNDMLGDVESAPGADAESAKAAMMLPAPTITADVLRLIKAFCSAEFYHQYCQYVTSVMPRDSREKGTIDALIDSTDPTKYNKIVEEGKAHIRTLVKFDQDPNDPYIYEMLLAAEYLNCKLLIDVTTGLITNIIAGKTPEQIAELFKISFDDLTEDDLKEAVAKVREDHANKIFLPDDMPITVPTAADKK